MDAIQNQIMHMLPDIEREHRIHIPIAVESGSRAWGFVSSDSDYDCRFIYVNPTEEYLTVFEPRDTIDFTPDAVYDIGGWDVRKVIVHLVKSNAVMLEWLSSGIVYRRNDAVHQALWQLGEAFFNPVSVCWHYLSMTKNKLEDVLSREESKLKTYCYILRPLAALRFIQAYGSIPYMEYRRNLDAIAVPPRVKAEIERLLLQKETALEGDTIPPVTVLTNYFKAECEQAEKWLSATHFERNRNYTLADECFRQILRMVWP